MRPQYFRQLQHEKPKVENHLRTCGKRNLTIFPFLQLHLNDTDLRWEYENYKVLERNIKLH